MLKIVYDAYQDFNIPGCKYKSAGRDIWVVNHEGIRNYVIVRIEEQLLERLMKGKNKLDDLLIDEVKFLYFG